MQNVAIENFFGTLKQVECVSSIELSRETESCFSYAVDFHYSYGLETFNDLLKEFKAHSIVKNKVLDTYSSEKLVNNSFGEETKRYQLIVIDDVSGAANESKKFARFLTVACTFNYSSVYMFHTIYGKKKQIEKQFFLKRIFLIFSRQVFH